MKVMSILRVLALCLWSVALSGEVFAADYSWRVAPSGSLSSAFVNTYFPSARAVCDGIPGAWAPGAWTATGVIISFTLTDAAKGSYGCVIQIKNSSGVTASSSQFAIARYGDGCAAGTIYNATTGRCDLPDPKAGQVCSDQKGPGGVAYIKASDGGCVPLTDADRPAMCKYMASYGTQYKKIRVRFNTDGTSPAADTDYKNALGCELDIQISSTCVMPPPACSNSNGTGVCMPKNEGTCLASVTFTGRVLSDAGGLQVADPEGANSGYCVDPANCKLPDLPKTEENKQCNYTTDAEGRKVCDSRQFSGEPGQQSCGDVNGTFQCVGKAPTANGIDISTKVDTKANSDGSTTSTKTDVATKYDCSGKYSDCKVTTTTTTTTTTKNAAGEVTGSNSQTTCKGDSCSGSSGTGGGGNGGKGDDTTNCDPATDPKACEGGSTDGGGKKCDAPIQCDGDAVMCAILQQQHKDTCELMAEPSDEEKSKFEQDKAAEISKVDALQDELDDKASGLFADFQAKATGNQYGGQCLADKSLEVFGATFTLPLSKICPYLVLLRYALIAMAYLAAARIVSRGI
ncbi:virulence factor TspB C-terminal domain-related protein [Pseudomonas sp. Pseusp97]|uniref:virulence factor TspB C-terminal domain-related protein n=1 Tax=Pseudomonas sp. Pseusp97 TaxID=3243065 RepID=UPI0039A4FAB0